MADKAEFLILSKYHLATAKRMFKSYYDFEEKRFLIGVINEAAKSVSSLIKFTLITEKINKKTSEKNLKVFIEKISPKYFDDLTRANILRILEVQKAQKASPIEFAKKDKIILLIEGKYRILTSKRLEEFLNSVQDAINAFQQKCRQI